MNKKVVFLAMAALFAVVIIINLFLLDFNDLGADDNKSIFIQIGANCLLLIAMLIFANRFKKNNS